MGGVSNKANASGRIPFNLTYVSISDPAVETADTRRIGKEVQVGSRVPGWVFRSTIVLASGIFLVVIGLMLVSIEVAEKV